METKQYAAAGPWISVEERLPEADEVVLIKLVPVMDGTFEPPIWTRGWVLSDGTWSVWGGRVNTGLERVTHWAEVNV